MKTKKIVPFMRLICEKIINQKFIVLSEDEPIEKKQKNISNIISKLAYSDKKKLRIFQNQLNIG
jgi:hypothetical protein